jgi:hypothetical protein
VQTSATSQSPETGRQVVPLGKIALLGQLEDCPVQYSATSHEIAAADRQTVVEAA